LSVFTQTDSYIYHSSYICLFSHKLTATYIRVPIFVCFHTNWQLHISQFLYLSVFTQTDSYIYQSSYICLFSHKLTATYITVPIFVCFHTNWQLHISEFLYLSVFTQTDSYVYQSSVFTQTGIYRHHSFYIDQLLQEVTVNLISHTTPCPYQFCNLLHSTVLQTDNLIAIKLHIYLCPAWFFSGCVSSRRWINLIPTVCSNTIQATPLTMPLVRS